MTPTNTAEIEAAAGLSDGRARLYGAAVRAAKKIGLGRSCGRQTPPPGFLIANPGVCPKGIAALEIKTWQDVLTSRILFALTER